MAFTKIQGAVPTDIGKLAIHFMTVDGTSAVFGTINFEAIDAVGVVVGEGVYNLMPHLTAAQVTTITNFMATLRTKAKAEAI